MTNTWIIVADSAHARIFQAPPGGKKIEEIKTLVNPRSRVHERAITTDKPGRSFDRMGPGRHAMSDNGDVKEHEAAKLCKTLADAIEVARANGQFECLILVAAPHFLGTLRKTLSPPAMRCVAKQIDKHMTDLEANDIQRRLQADGCRW